MARGSVRALAGASLLVFTAGLQGQAVSKPAIAEGASTAASRPRSRGAHYDFVRAFGADPTGTRHSTAAFAAALARSDSPTITIGPGVFRLACSLLGVGLQAASAVSLEGAGERSTILRLDPGCPMTTPLATWNGMSGVRVRNLTIDFNTPAEPRSTQTALAFFAYSKSASGLLIDHVAVIGTTSPVLNIGVAAAGGHTYSDIAIRGSRSALAAPAASQNQCIALTTVGGAGSISDFRISRNVCVNSGLQIDGTHGEVDHNDVSGFEFGSAIFVAYEVGLPKSASHLTIEGNLLHDSPATCDVNGTPPAGIENDGDETVISGNVIRDLGGEGLRNYGRHVTIAANTIFDNGRTGAHCGSFGLTAQAGIHLGYARAGYDSIDVLVSANHVYDGAGTQLYAYIDDPGVVGPVTLVGNRMSGARRALNVRSAPGAVIDEAGRTRRGRR